MHLLESTNFPFRFNHTSMKLEKSVNSKFMPYIKFADLTEVSQGPPLCTMHNAQLKRTNLIGHVLVVSALWHVL